jgi:hypothetical protein
MFVFFTSLASVSVFPWPFVVLGQGSQSYHILISYVNKKNIIFSIFPKSG